MEKDLIAGQPPAENPSAQQSKLKASTIEQKTNKLRERSHGAAGLLQVGLLSLWLCELHLPSTRIDHESPQPNHLISIFEFRSTLLALWRGAVFEGH